MFLQSSIYSGFNFLSLKYQPGTAGVCFNVSAGIWYLAIGRHNKEAIPSIQDWSDVIDESGESVYSNMVE